MLCVICISRGGSASVSFSEVEERAVDLRNVSTVPSQSEPTRHVRSDLDARQHANRVNLDAICGTENGI